MRALQKSRRPINVSTGKRRYKNMLVRSIAVVTDSHSENILMATVSLQEVIIVSTQTTSTVPIRRSRQTVNRIKVRPARRAARPTRARSRARQSPTPLLPALSTQEIPTSVAVAGSPMEASASGVSAPAATISAAPAVKTGTSTWTRSTFRRQAPAPAQASASRSLVAPDGGHR